DGHVRRQGTADGGARDEPDRDRRRRQQVVRAPGPVTNRQPDGGDGHGPECRATGGNLWEPCVQSPGNDHVGGPDEHESPWVARWTHDLASEPRGVVTI